MLMALCMCNNFSIADKTIEKIPRSSVLVAQRTKLKANAKPVLCDNKVQAFTSDDNPLVSFGGVAYKTEGECKTSIL